MWMIYMSIKHKLQIETLIFVANCWFKSFILFLSCCFAGVVFGNLHFITFDGLSYTFSGRGEYYLVSSGHRELRVQARTTQLKLKNGEFTFKVYFHPYLIQMVLLYHFKRRFCLDINCSRPLQ